MPKSKVRKSIKKISRDYICPFNEIHMAIRNSYRMNLAPTFRKSSMGRAAKQLGISSTRLGIYLGQCQLKNPLLSFEYLFSTKEEEMEQKMGDAYKKALIPPRRRPIETQPFKFIYKMIEHEKNITKAAGRLGIYPKVLKQYLKMYSFNRQILSYRLLKELSKKYTYTAMRLEDDCVLPITTTCFEISSLFTKIAPPAAPSDEILTPQKINFPSVCSTSSNGMAFPLLGMAFEPLGIDFSSEKIDFPINPSSDAKDDKQTSSTAENPYGFYYNSASSTELIGISDTDIFEKGISSSFVSTPPQQNGSVITHSIFSKHPASRMSKVEERPSTHARLG